MFCYFILMDVVFFFNKKNIYNKQGFYRGITITTTCVGESKQNGHKNYIKISVSNLIIYKKKKEKKDIKMVGG